jgi:Bacterial TniB protein
MRCSLVNPIAIEPIAELIKYLANELGLSIVLAGTERAENVIASDLQLVSRFPISHLPRWKNDSAYKEFLMFLESTIPLQKPSNHQDQMITFESLKVNFINLDVVCP